MNPTSSYYSVEEDFARRQGRILPSPARAPHGFRATSPRYLARRRICGVGLAADRDQWRPPRFGLSEPEALAVCHRIGKVRAWLLVGRVSYGASVGRELPSSTK